MTEPLKPFSELFEDPDHAAGYAEGPARFMPGFRAVQRMAGVLIREAAPSDGHIMVHGAGGGLELEAFAAENPGWSFTGVEPAAAMLEEARKRLTPFSGRVAFHHGYADTAPAGPYDGATSLLTLHFLKAEPRRETVADIVRRLRPGAPFVAAHASFPQAPAPRGQWLARHREFAIASGIAPETAEIGRQALAERIDVLDPETDAQILRGAGLRDVTLFYSAFTWRGWVGYKA
ncbi:MAG: class I SAM-dependent methyltransferase [Pseudomonadota bacterium]